MPKLWRRPSIPFFQGIWAEFEWKPIPSFAGEIGVSCNSCTSGGPPVQTIDLVAVASRLEKLQARLCCRHNRGAARALQVVAESLALLMRLCCLMKMYAHDTVRRLMELEALEERLALFQRKHENCADVQALIESLRANLSVGVLIGHDRMRSKGKSSVVAVLHSVCSGCHLALALGNIAALRRGDMRQCGNCGRDLYLLEEGEDQRRSTARAQEGRPAAGEAPVRQDAN